MFIDLNLDEVMKQIKVKDKYQSTIESDKGQSKLIKKVRKVISKHNIKHTDHEFRRAIGNACHHGKAPIQCDMHVGKDGEFICIIRDSGSGFDFKDTIAKFERGEKYFQFHGYGMRTYARNKHVQVGWTDEGKTIALIYNVKSK
jgi:hypothetical protein